MAKGKHTVGSALVVLAVAFAHVASAEPPAPEAETASGLLTEGYRLLRAGDESGAERAYLRAARVQPGYAPAWVVLGDFYYRLRGDCSAAMPWYRGYLERDRGIGAPLDAVLTRMLICVEADERWDEAASLCDRLVRWYRERRLHRDADEALLGRAENELRAGRYEQGLTTLQTLMFRDASNRRVWELRAFARFQLGRYTEALEDQYWIRGAFGPERYVHREIGATLFKLGRLDDALAALERSLHIDGEHADTLRWIARTFEGLGRPVDAEGAWRQCLAAGPGRRLDALARNNLAWLLADQSRAGDPRLLEAWSLASAAVEADVAEPMYRDTLAEVYRRLGRYDDALEASRAAFRDAPADAYYRRRFFSARAAADGFATSGGASRFERGAAGGLNSGPAPSRNRDR